MDFSFFLEKFELAQDVKNIVKQTIKITFKCFITAPIVILMVQTYSVRKVLPKKIDHRGVIFDKVLYLWVLRK